ncbi:MAG: SDR family oxidoreductase [Flavobacteriales bacterium]|nr:SDR family oxidoreductase [Flavobacteriales bacterium]
MKETALITGASSGIGYQFALILADKGFDLIITARNTEKLTELKEQILSKTKVNVVILEKDLSIINSANELYADIKNQGLKVTILINNAGFGDYNEFTKTDIEKQLEMVQLNIASLISLTRFFLNGMQIENYGKILNVSSILAFFPMPLFSVYASTKSFVLSFSEALNEELKQTNISVTCLCPGPTKSNFTQNSEMGQSRELIKT